MNFDFQIYFKIVNNRFLVSPITYLHLDLKNSKWRSRFIKINQIFLHFDLEIYLKIITQGFLGSLTTDLYSDLKNSKGLIQYGGQGL